MTAKNRMQNRADLTTLRHELPKLMTPEEVAKVIADREIDTLITEIIEDKATRPEVKW